MLQTETMIQYTVRCHTDLAVTELFYGITFFYISKEEINIILHICFFRFHFFCKSVIFDCIAILACACHHFFCIENGHAVVFLPIHLFIQFHRFFCILRFHDQKQLVVAKITFDSIVPCLVFHIEKVSKDLHIYKLSALLM